MHFFGLYCIIALESTVQKTQSNNQITAIIAVGYIPERSAYSSEKLLFGLNRYLEEMLIYLKYEPVIAKLSILNGLHRIGRSQLPRGLRRRSVAARLLGLRVRIPPGEWMSVSCECCVL